MRAFPTLLRSLHAAIAALLVLGSGALLAQSSIITTKHNLSSSGPGTIKASTESEVCVFCHTPHSKNQTTQLWNHTLSTANYLLYNSDYLTSINYAAGAQPGSRSRLCLACHDGTIAVGAVYNNPGSGSSGSIAMSGGITQLPAGNAGNLGTNLANDHPVGFAFDWTKDVELVSRTFPWPGPVLLTPNSAAGTVECTSCHQPHSNQYSPFLVASNASAALCVYCHNKTGWSTAIHKTSTQAYTPPGSTLTTIGEWACRNCHDSHGGLGVPYILTGSEENTCYQAGCHGSTSKGANTKDIQTQAAKTYRHPSNTVSGKHKNPDNTVSLRTPNRHAECQDCHDAHKAQKGLHTLKSNAVSNVLAGVSGVTAGSASIWTQPTAFTAINPVTQEWQICYKCHTYNGLGTLTNGVSTVTGPSGTALTDQAWEFNPANRSAHPVQVALNSMTGSLTTKALATAQMTAAWNSVGTQMMYCADCHGADAATSTTVPQGPHGSSLKFMLTGTGKYWPTNAGGTVLWSLSDIQNNTNSWSANLFCVNCHPMKTGSTWYNNVHSRSDHQSSTIYCITCHVVVPHGAKRSRLIGYASEPAPWNWNGAANYAKLRITGFRKYSRNSYVKDGCNFPNNVCHGPQSGTFEN